MNKSLSKPLSQIADEQHQTALVFVKYNLNYPSKGRHCLDQACSENDIFLNEVTAELQNIYAIGIDELDFNKVKLYQLADYIISTHHSYVKKEMPQILSYLEELVSNQGDQYSELYGISEWFVDLVNEMTHHMHKEETILFPRIKQLVRFGFELIPYNIENYQYLQLPIMDMVDEHANAGNIMEEIKKLANNYEPPVDASTTFKLLYASLEAFELDLHRHIHLENSILFPKALALEKELRIYALN